MTDPLLKAAKEIEVDLVSWRRHLHAHPELSFEEHATSAFVEEKLKALGLKPKRLAKTGLTCLIEGQAPGPTPGPIIALRADMDALPIQEDRSAPYASKHPGKAHLCGHDAHTAILLGAAQLLTQQRPERGSIKLLFQPAEEGLAGAKHMVEEGALEGVGAVAGLHVHHSAETGFATVCLGQSTAAADSFDLTVVGKGGHAAHPHLSIDAVTVTAQVITALQQISSRQISPLSPLVITIGTVQGGFARNVIAPEVRLSGTVRTLDPATRDEVPARMETVVQGVCAAFGASYELSYTRGYPSSHNDPALMGVLEEAALSVLGEGRLSQAPPTMGAEDFAYYTQRLPGMLFRLGIRSEAKGSVYPLHHPRFDIDEDALPLGAALLARFAHLWLERA